MIKVLSRLVAPEDYVLRSAIAIADRWCTCPAPASQGETIEPLLTHIDGLKSRDTRGTVSMLHAIACHVHKYVD
jgi:hypothetical protein